MKIDLTKKNLKKTYRIYYWPIIILMVSACISISILILYGRLLAITTSSDQKSILEISVNTVLMFIATGTGIFVPILFQRNYKGEDQRRSMLFALSAVWSELRASKHLLSEIMTNYSFDYFLSETEDSFTLEEKIEILVLKIESLDSIFSPISSAAFDAMISNQTISYLKSDEIYNLICQTYENLSSLQSMYGRISSGIKLRYSSTKIMMSRGSVFTGTEFEERIESDLRKSLSNLRIEIEFNQLMVDRSLHELVLYLSTFGIKVEEEEKEYQDEPYAPPLSTEIS